MAATKPFTVDTSLFRKKTQRLLNMIGKEKDLYLDEQAGLLFRDVAKYTPPFANGKLPKANANTYGTTADRKAGQGAVVRDVYRSMRAIAPANRWDSQRVKAAIKAKDTKALKTIFENAEKSAYKGWEVDLFNRKFHRRARNSRGRVTRQQKQLVLTKPQFNAYLRKVVKRVGQAKAYFAQAAMRMGRKPAPKWIAQHFGRYRANVLRSENNRTGVASHGAFVHTQRFLPFISKNRAISAEKRLLFLTKKAIKNSGFKTKVA